MDNNRSNPTSLVLDAQPSKGQPNVAALVRGLAIDPEVLAVAAAIWRATQADGGEISPEAAIRAALHFERTDEVMGRDSYVVTKDSARLRAGAIIEGYRAVQNRIDRPWQVRCYRQPTAEERELHGLDPKGKALVCEIDDLEAAQAARAAGLPYRPIVGLVYYAPDEKIHVPATKTQRWVLEKNARKDALRQMGIAADAEDVLETARQSGIEVDLPAGAFATRDQAVALVKAAAEQARREGMSDEEKAAAVAAAQRRMAQDKLRWEYNDWLFAGGPCPRCGAPAGAGHAQSCAFRIEGAAQGAAVWMPLPSADVSAAGESARPPAAQEPVRAEPPPEAAYLAALKARWRNHAARREGPPSIRQLNYARGSLASLCGNDETRRHAVIHFLFDVDNTAELTSGQCSALIEWIGSRQQPDGAWTPAAEATADLRLILAQAEQ